MVQKNNGITPGISGKDGIQTQGEEIPLFYFQGKKKLNSFTQQICFPFIHLLKRDFL